jgi:hypothetical protein
VDCIEMYKNAAERRSFLCAGCPSTKSWRLRIKGSG